MSEQDRKPHPLDVAAGQRIRERRRSLGLSQQQLARSVGVTFQQIQKYELGSNRMGVSRLAQIAFALSCRVQDLVEGLDAGNIGQVEPLNRLLSEANALELLETYAALPARFRGALLQHAKALAAACAPPQEAP
ncbi:MAG: helix-turn-helix transcriptional regulator [Alphaproteobacteria bacterium]|nr:helix-turn-helix transcriptional regulator [Alphaproteobacteria bacterium]